MKHLVVKPVITEKTSSLTAQNVYAFEVHGQATKQQVAATLESMYGVKVATVRSATRKGKTRRVGRRQVTVQMPDRKIMYVKLASGSIDLFPKS